LKYNTNLPPFHNIGILFYITMHGFEVATQFGLPTFLNVVGEKCFAMFVKVGESD
jgi:hypothetical protein